MSLNLRPFRLGGRELRQGMGGWVNGVKNKIDIDIPCTYKHTDYNDFQGITKDITQNDIHHCPESLRTVLGQLMYQGQ